MEDKQERVETSTGDRSPVRKPQGFATMTRERRAEISRMGGKAAHASGKAHRFTSEEAKRVGVLGGRASYVGAHARLSTPPEAQS